LVKHNKGIYERGCFKGCPLSNLKTGEMMESDIKIGTVVNARDIGMAGGAHKYIWLVCPVCGKGRWIQHRKRVIDMKCHRCAPMKPLSVPTDPKVGDICRGKDIGKGGSERYIWGECSDCGKGRWMQYRKSSLPASKCISCVHKEPDNPCPNPQEGDVRLGRNIGKRKDVGYIYINCPMCKDGRWVQRKNGKPISYLCRKCSAKKIAIDTHYPEWTVGRIKRRDGYIDLLIKKDDFYYPMARSNGYLYEHRYFMAQHLGRCLQKWEIVHHKNGIRDDNRIENLELTSSLSEHILEHSKGYKAGHSRGLVDGRIKQVQELKELIENQTKQIRLLQWQVNNTKIDI
jgi:hypothetical protein